MPTFQRNGFATYYEESGSGEPIVFIVGLSGDLQVWRFQVAELSKTHRVITYDNRGAGRTSAPDEPYSISQMADDLTGLLDHLEIPVTHLVGWSMGGLVAQRFTLANPERVRKLMLLGTFGAPDGYLREGVLCWANMRRSTMTYEQTVRYVAHLLFSHKLARNQKAYEAFVGVMVNNPYRQKDHAFFRQVEASLDYTAPPSLAALGGQRTTVLVGEHDYLTPRYLSEELVAEIPGAAMRVLPGAHAGFVEFPDAYNQAIREITAS